jgi:hypothetical protein
VRQQGIRIARGFPLRLDDFCSAIAFFTPHQLGIGSRSKLNFERAATMDHGPQAARKMRAGLNLSQALAGRIEGGHDAALSTTWFWRIAALRKW